MAPSFLLILLFAAPFAILMFQTIAVNDPDLSIQTHLRVFGGVFFGTLWRYSAFIHLKLYRTEAFYLVFVTLQTI